MKSYKLALGASICCLALLLQTPAHAASIDYVFSGTFDGSLGTSTYTNQAFTVTLTGDTAAVTSGGGELSNLATSTNFTIGSTTGSLQGSYNDVVLNPGFSGGTIIFGQGQSSTPFFVGEGLSAPSLGAYDLTTALALTTGPVSQTPGSAYLTSAGNLVFSNISSLSFEAELLPTPLPSTLPLFAVSIGAVGLLSWHQRKKPAVFSKK